MTFADRALESVLVVASDATVVLGVLDRWSADTVIAVTSDEGLVVPESAGAVAPDLVVVVAQGLASDRLGVTIDEIARRFAGVPVVVVPDATSAAATTPDQWAEAARPAEPAAVAAEPEPAAATEPASAASPEKPNGSRRSSGRKRVSRRDRVMALARRHRQVLAVGVAGVLVVAVLGALAGLVGGEAVMGAGLAVVLVLVLALAVRVEQHQRAVQRRLTAIDRRTLQVKERQRRLVADLKPRKLTGSVEVIRDASKHVRATAQAVAVSRLTQVDLTSTVHRLDRDLRSWRKHDFSQLQATVNLFTSLPVTAPVPPMRGWAASPDFLVVLITEILRRRPRVIVELGSGVSTLWMARAIRSAELDTRIISLDHEDAFGQQTRDLLALHGLSDIAEVRFAPLTDVPTERGPMPWYSPDAIASLTDIDLVVVDGPPAATGPLARYPALPALLDRLSPDAVVVLDDTIRADEREIIDLWRELTPLTRVDMGTEKGTTILTREGRR